MVRKNTRAEYPEKGNKRPNAKRLAGAAVILVLLAGVLFVFLKAGATAQANAKDEQLHPTATIFITPSRTASIAPTPIRSSTPTPAFSVSPSPEVTKIPQPTKNVKETPAQSPTPTPKATAVNSGELPDILLQKKVTIPVKSTQIVVVLASGNKAEVTLYDKNEQGQWETPVAANGNVGKTGVSADRHEGDGSTPLGVYKLGFAFGNKDNPGTKLEYRAVTSNSYWVDDPKSVDYNKWVEGTGHKDWNSAEELWKAQTAYAYALVVEYNYGSSTVPGKGSAIFLHCGSKSTVGCISIPEEKMKEVLRTLDPQKEPIIVITN